jgi:hypothetical protein
MDCCEVVNNGRSISDCCKVVDTDLNGSKISDCTIILLGDVDHIEIVKLELKPGISFITDIFFLNLHTHLHKPFL